MEIAVENIVHFSRRQKARIHVGIVVVVVAPLVVVVASLVVRGIIVEDCIQIQVHIDVAVVKHLACCVARILIVLLRLMDRRRRDSSGIIVQLCADNP